MSPLAFFRMSGVEAAAVAADECLFDLVGDDRADLAEVFPDLVDLLDGSKQELKVAGQVTGISLGVGGIVVVAGRHEVEDVDLITLLAVPVDAAVALLHHVRVPGDLDVDQVRAVVLEVDALAGGVGGEEDPPRRRPPTGRPGTPA